jgi:hypothetical protein
MRSLEELTGTLSFLGKHTKKILICFAVLTVIGFTILTWAGIKSESPYQPYRRFESDYFDLYRVAIDRYAPLPFIRDYLRMSASGRRIDPRITAFQKAWITLVEDKAVFDLIVSASVSSALICLLLVILLKRHVRLKNKEFRGGAILGRPFEINRLICSDINTFSLDTCKKCASCRNKRQEYQ